MCMVTVSIEVVKTGRYEHNHFNYENCGHVFPNPIFSLRDSCKLFSSMILVHY